MTVHTHTAPQVDLDADKTLLLVDDDTAFLRRLARAMESRGFDVDMAESVAMGLAKVKASSEQKIAALDQRVSKLNGEVKTKKEAIKDLESKKGAQIKELQGQLRETQREVANLKKQQEKAARDVEKSTFGLSRYNDIGIRRITRVEQRYGGSRRFPNSGGKGLRVWGKRWVGK